MLVTILDIISRTRRLQRRRVRAAAQWQREERQAALDRLLAHHGNGREAERLVVVELILKQAGVADTARRRWLQRRNSRTS